jgi:hypothetical protein
MNQINSGDLFNKKFSSGFRGYDKSQVENHIQTLSREFEILENKILDLENKIKEQKTENDKFKSVESSLIITLKTAEDTAKGIIEKAKEDAKGILDDARKELIGIKLEYEKIMLLRDSTIKDIGDLKEKINLGLDEIGVEANFNEIEESIDAVEQNIDSDDINKEAIKDQKTISNDEAKKDLEEELFTEESLDLDLEEDKINNDNQEIISESIDSEEVDEKNDEELEETQEESDLNNIEDNQEPSDLFSDDEEEKNNDDDQYELVSENEEEDNQEPSDLFLDDEEEKNNDDDQYELVSENEEEDNQEIISDKKEMSADDIFGGENLEKTDEIVKDIVSSEEKEEYTESLEEETPDDKLDSEEVTPDKKKSDNVQKSFFDTFDENQ